MRLNARRIGHSRMVLLAMEDVNRRLADAEAHYLRLFEAAKDGILIFDAETEILQEVNPFFLKMMGCEREELVGRRYAEIDILRAPFPDVSLISEARERTVASRGYMPLTTRRLNRIQVELVASAYHSQGRQMIQVNVRDVTMRNQAILAMQESEERFRLLVDSVQDHALFQMDPAGRIASWNSAPSGFWDIRNGRLSVCPASVCLRRKTWRAVRGSRNCRLPAPTAAPRMSDGICARMAAAFWPAVC